MFSVLLRDLRDWPTSLPILSLTSQCSEKQTTATHHGPCQSVEIAQLLESIPLQSLVFIAVIASQPLLVNYLTANANIHLTDKDDRRLETAGAKAAVLFVFRMLPIPQRPA